MISPITTSVQGMQLASQLLTRSAGQINQAYGAASNLATLVQGQLAAELGQAGATPGNEMANLLTPATLEAALQATPEMAFANMLMAKHAYAANAFAFKTAADTESDFLNLFA